MKSSFGMGKYRDLLLAILLFIVLDLGILFFNFFVSLQLERDAGRINSAGELRMLTQQLTKSLLTLQAETLAELPTQTSMAQLNQGYEGFNHALSTLGESLQQAVGLTEFGADSAGLSEIMAKLEREWRPLAETIAPVLQTQAANAQDIEIAVTKAVARNIRLMALSDDLARGVETAANQKTNRMRQIQLMAIVLALLNFFYIVFKFLRRLNASDRIAENARREVDDILKTVAEGLLLVRADGTIGSQFSGSTTQLFMRELHAGEDFRRLIRSLVGEQRAEEAASFLDLMFNPRVKPALLTQLDPLKEVLLAGSDKDGGKPKYLSFFLNQVHEEDRIKELLVTVFDVTQKVQLERELAATQAAAKSDVDDLIRVLQNEPALLQDFLASTCNKLSSLNTAMRDVGQDFKSHHELLGAAARMVHGIKGEAAAMGLNSMSRQAHHMEDVLAPLLKAKAHSGEDMIPVAFEISCLQEQAEQLQRVFSRIDGAVGQIAPGAGSALDAMVSNLRHLSEQVAQSLNKQVKLTTQLMDLPLPESVTKVLREALPQLVRNAVVHGIETPDLRLKSGKPLVGSLRLEIGRDKEGCIEVSLSDDGRGIVMPEIRQQVALHRSDADRLTDQELMGFIFEPQFSTAKEVTEHAGRGIGLALVRELVEKAGARMRVMTQPQQSTRFVMLFKVEAA